MNLPKIVERLGGVRPVPGDGFAPFSENELALLEHSLGARFPIAYREFLKRYGASTFAGNPPDHSLIEYSPPRPLPAAISRNGKGYFSFFYGSNEKGRENWSIVTHIQRYAGRMPENLIPIGEDYFGNQLCMGIEGAAASTIYFWDHDNEPMDEEDYLTDFGTRRPNEAIWENVHPIASSFEDFLSRLRVAED